MPSLVLVLLVAVTSLIAFWFGVGALKLRPSGLRRAACLAADTVGLAAIFFGVNLFGWVVAVLGARLLFGWFVSIYLFSGVTIGVLSLIQGLAFQRWWESGARSEEPVKNA